MTARTIRCAVYTRKSSDEGLDQAFNSLEAQHEACAAYVASQRHEGWKLLATRYDDGGVSGGTLDRPALQRLLAHIGAGRVDMVVVYKIDRLTRSLADFAKLVERLEAANCSFVSVTQAFNTSSSMGRLTLNVLLSFAQFEREVTAERIRDKLAASKKKGLWMGGLPPLGYDPHPDRQRRELVVNPAEADTVRQIFALYLEAGCLSVTARAAEERGLRSKRRVFGDGRVSGNGIFSRGQIHALLTNPVYRGQIRHREKTWPGLHPAIIEEDLWQRVRDRLAAASARRRGTGRAHGSLTQHGTSAPLLGKFRDETGDPLTPTHTQGQGRRFRYYVSHRLVTGERDPAGWRLPAEAFERHVAHALADHLDGHARRHAVLQAGGLPEQAAAGEMLHAFATRLREEGVTLVAPAIGTGTVAVDRVRMTLEPGSFAELFGLDPARLDPSLLSIDAVFACRRRGVEMRIVSADEEPAPDPALLRALRHAHRWAGLLKSGDSLGSIARREGFSESYVARILPLATLSPRLQQRILAGTQPLSLTLETLVRTQLPLDWRTQEARFGIET